MILGVRQPLVLSPMVDVTDPAFRSLAAAWGADVTVSEMVAAAGINHGNQKSWRLVEPWPGEAPYGVQLMGAEPDEVAQAAVAVATRARPDFIDINLGCPSPHVLRSCAGGFLLSDPSKVGRVVAATVGALDEVAPGVAVSVKLRTGLDAAHPTFLAVGQEAEAAGAAWCTLHGRSVEQGYAGAADWDAIAALVEALGIPVIGNGDLKGPDDVVRMRDQTGCAGFFIARAAMHDPTVFRRMRQALDGQPVDDPPGIHERIGLLREYVRRAASLGDVPLAILKRQATRFVQGAPGARAARVAIQQATTLAQIDDRLASLEVAGLHHDERQAEERRRVDDHGNQRRPPLG